MKLHGRKVLQYFRTLKPNICEIENTFLYNQWAQKIRTPIGSQFKLPVYKNKESPFLKVGSIHKQVIPKILWYCHFKALIS